MQQYRMGVSAILAAWETGAARRPLDRAMAILWAAGADDDGDPVDLPLAERDRRLLAVRAGTFGPMLPTRVTCPNCGMELEMDLDVRQLAAALPPDKGGSGDGRLRPLSSRDLAAVSGMEAVEMARTLRARLAETAEGDDAETLDRQIEEVAEQAELAARVACADCGAEWYETLDVPAHVWADVETAALRLLGEVAELASAFGWSEREVLSLTPARRAAYLARARLA